LVIAPHVSVSAEQLILGEAKGAVQAVFQQVPSQGGERERRQAEELLRQVEKVSRERLAPFTGEMAFVLSYIADAHARTGNVVRARALYEEAAQRIRPLRDFFPDHYVSIQARYAGFLIWQGRRPEALSHTRDAIGVCMETFADVSLLKRNALLSLSDTARQLGDVRAANEAQAAANLAGTENQPAGFSGYTEERRAVWLGRLHTWRSDLRDRQPQATNSFQELSAMLERDFKAFPVERALGLVEIGEIQIETMLLVNVQETVRKARAIVDTAPENFADVEISLLELEGRVLLANLRFEEAALRFATAWRKANTLLAPHSDLRPGYTSRIARYLASAARPKASLILLKELEISLEAGNRLQSRDAVHLYIQYASVYLTQGDLDEAEQMIAIGLQLARSVSYEGMSHSPMGQPELSPEQRRSTDAISGTGRFLQVQQLRTLHGLLGSIYATRGDLDSWKRNAETSLRNLREFPGEASPQYLLEADTVMFFANVLGLVEDARRLALAQIELLKRNPTLDTFLSQRAQMILNPQQETETMEQKINRLRTHSEALASSPPDRARYRLFLYDTLRQAGRNDEAEAVLGQVEQWRDTRTSQAAFAVDAAMAARQSFLDALPLSMLLQRLASRRAVAGPAEDSLDEDTFITAQSRVGTNAASLAIAQLGVRSALQGNAEALGKIREYQVAAADLTYYDRMVAESIGRPDMPTASPEALAATRIKLAALGEEIRALTVNNPALAHTGPVSLAEAKAALREDQALVLYFMNYDWRPETDPPVGYAFVLTKAKARIVPLCNVKDPCHDGRTHREIAQHRKLTTPPDGRGQGLVDTPQGGPNVATIGKSLYDALWLPVEQALAATGGKRKDHVIIVPDTALDMLPFAALVAETVDGRASKYLVEQHPISYMPSVRAFISVHAMQSGDRLRPTLLALGDPVVKGAAAAGAPQLRNVLLAAGRSDTDIDEVPALPETTIEMCRLALLVGSLSEDLSAWLDRSTELDQLERCKALSTNSGGRVTVLSGPEATKRRLLELSRKGVLNPVGVLAFATHGVALGVDGDEPALLLSPTADRSPGERFLSIIDIVGLDLSADVVLLSACRTADTGIVSRVARQSPTMAAAFMQAGAKSVLATVSTIDSNAATSLVSHALENRIKRADTMAVSLQKAMMDEIANNRPPSYWSPLVLYGVN
jgi:CHAT domain-containing protein